MSLIKSPTHPYSFNPPFTCDISQSREFLEFLEFLESLEFLEFLGVDKYIELYLPEGN